MSTRVSKLPLVLLGLQTLMTLGGPLAILLVLRGGRSRSWPPDRSVEWMTFWAVVTVFVALMLACLAIGLINWRRMMSAASSSGGRGERRDA